MKRLVVAIVCALTCTSAIWGLPVLYPDSLNVPDDDPRRGVRIFVPASPTGSITYEVWWEGKGGDPLNQDFNDLVVGVAINSGFVTLFYIGSNSCCTDILGYDGQFFMDRYHQASVSLGYFAPNSEVVLDLWAAAGDVVHTGDTRRALVAAVVPEPSTFLLLAGGAGVLLAFRRESSVRILTAARSWCAGAVSGRRSS